MSTAAALAKQGAKHIKRACWKEGRVYMVPAPQLGDPFTWCYIHPHDTPDPKPQAVFLNMLPGDDWEEIEEEPVKKVSKSSVHYREAQGMRKCGNCGMFKNGLCDLVLGKIEKPYVCDKWVKK